MSTKKVGRTRTPRKRTAPWSALECRGDVLTGDVSAAISISERDESSFGHVRGRRRSMVLTAMLESAGMQVRTAATVPDALALLATYTPTVLCSDIGLLDDDGYALIRNVRSLADPEKKSVPAIALTAFNRNEDRKRALVEGFNVHLTKPVEPATLVRTVLELAGRST